MQELHRTPWFNLLGYLACTVRYSDGSKRTVLQHREIMEAYLARKLTRDEVAHHKDKNRSNNVLSNLELMSKIEHARLHGLEKGKPVIQLMCLMCDGVFIREVRNEKRNRLTLNQQGPFLW